MSKIKTAEEFYNDPPKSYMPWEVIGDNSEVMYPLTAMILFGKLYHEYAMKAVIEELESLSNTTPDPDTPDSYFNQGLKHAIEILTKNQERDEN